MTSRELLDLEMRKCFDFFWETSNHEKDSPGYGLMLDRSNNPAVSSIASVGFALTGIVIGILHKYITYEAGLERVKGTLHTLLYNVPILKVSSYISAIWTQRSVIKAVNTPPLIPRCV